jgi:hypothetical protein
MNRKSSMWMVSAAIVALAACGGGGSSEPARSVHFNTATLTGTAFQHQAIDVNAFTAASVSVEATISEPINETVYVVVRDNAQGFQGSTISITQLTGDRFQATLQPNAELEPGTYTGQLTLLLCKDSACNNTYSLTGQTLPYSMTITPQLAVDVYVDGVLAGTVKSGEVDLPISIASGSQLELKSSIPMMMQYSSGAFGLARIDVDSGSTPTDWKGTVTNPYSTFDAGLQMVVVPQDSSYTIQRSANTQLTVPPAGP